MIRKILFVLCLTLSLPVLAQSYLYKSGLTGALYSSVGQACQGDAAAYNANGGAFEGATCGGECSDADPGSELDYQIWAPEFSNGTCMGFYAGKVPMPCAEGEGWDSALQMCVEPLSLPCTDISGQDVSYGVQGNSISDPVCYQSGGYSCMASLIGMTNPEPPTVATYRIQGQSCADYEAGLDETSTPPPTTEENPDLTPAENPDATDPNDGGTPTDSSPTTGTDGNPACPPGYTYDSANNTCYASCPYGYSYDSASKKCVAIGTGTGGATADTSGSTWMEPGQRTGSFDIGSANKELFDARNAFKETINRIQNDAAMSFSVAGGSGGGLPCGDSINVLGKTFSICAADYENDLAIIGLGVVALSLLVAAFIVLR